MPHIAEARRRAQPLEEQRDEQPVAESWLEWRVSSASLPVQAKATEELQRTAATAERASEQEQPESARPESAACVPAELLLRAGEPPDAERASLLLLLCVRPDQLPVSLTAAVLVSAVRVAQ